jgi:glutathionylspermidine synthase
MQRITIAERPDWRRQAVEAGFRHHSIDGTPYWDESAYYAFSLRQIEDDLEAPSAELHAMAMDLLDGIVASEQRLRQLAIPEPYWEWIAASWRAREPHLYGRLDLAYDGHGPAKLYELNYDTPTSLFEASFFQWQWLEDQRANGGLGAGSDQFNAIHEALIERFAQLGAHLHQPLYFAALREAAEDQATVDYLREGALQAGLTTELLAIEDIGLSADGRFTDLHDRIIGSLFKLYPLEELMRDRFGAALPKAGVQLIEPAWKALLSNKGILPLLWQAHPGHPNLLEARFDAEGNAPPAGWVRKPLFSREGANIALHWPDGRQLASDGPYRTGPWIQQAAHPLPSFAGRYPLVGSWIVGDAAVGIGIREDAGPITRDSARFLPHVITEAVTGGVLYA